MELGHVDTASRRHYIVRKTCYIHCTFKLLRLASSDVTLRLDPSKPNVQIQRRQTDVLKCGLQTVTLFQISSTG
jgi:hypothetical protein